MVELTYRPPGVHIDNVWETVKAMFEEKPAGVPYGFTEDHDGVFIIVGSDKDTALEALEDALRTAAPVTITLKTEPSKVEMFA